MLHDGTSVRETLCLSINSGTRIMESVRPCSGSRSASPGYASSMPSKCLGVLRGDSGEKDECGDEHCGSSRAFPACAGNPSNVSVHCNALT
jgi:hypothetical protein